MKGSCVTCGGLEIYTFIEHIWIWNKTIHLWKYKSVTYRVKDAKELKKCDLVNTNISIVEFMRIFQERLVYEYAMHTHRVRWLDKQIKLYKDTFPLGAIVSIVYFLRIRHYSCKMKCNLHITTLHKLLF